MKRVTPFLLKFVLLVAVICTATATQAHPLAWLGHVVVKGGSRLIGIGGPHVKNAAPAGIKTVTVLATKGSAATTAKVATKAVTTAAKTGGAKAATAGSKLSKAIPKSRFDRYLDKADDVVDNLVPMDMDLPLAAAPVAAAPLAAGVSSIDNVANAAWRHKKKIASAAALTAAVVHGGEIVKVAGDSVVKPVVTGSMEHVAQPIASQIASWLGFFMPLIILGVLLKFTTTRRRLLKSGRQLFNWVYPHAKKHWQGSRLAARLTNR